MGWMAGGIQVPKIDLIRNGPSTRGTWLRPPQQNSRRRGAWFPAECSTLDTAERSDASCLPTNRSVQI
jgi:hypothetical protein